MTTLFVLLLVIAVVFLTVILIIQSRKEHSNGPVDPPSRTSKRGPNKNK